MITSSTLGLTGVLLNSYPCIRLTNIVDPRTRAAYYHGARDTDYVLMAELLIISVLLLRSRNVVTEGSAATS